MQQKKEAMPPFFALEVYGELLHDDLLGFATGIDEVDASGEVADVDAVDTSVAFSGHDDLTHHVVDGDVGILAEGDTDLVGGGVRIDAHVCVVAQVSSLWT